MTGLVSKPAEPPRTLRTVFVEWCNAYPCTACIIAGGAAGTLLLFLAQAAGAI